MEELVLSMFVGWPRSFGVYSSLFYKAMPASERELALRRLIDG